MASVRDAHVQFIVSGREVGEIGVVPHVDLHPVFVETFQFVGIPDLLEFTVIQGGERDVEGVLAVSDGDLRFFAQFLVHRTVRSGFDQLVVDGEMLENKRNGPFAGSVQRIEPGDSVCAAEHQRTVRQDAGRAVVELVPADAVGTEEMNESTDRSVVLRQAVHRTDPNIPLKVLFDGTDVQAGKTFQWVGFSQRPVVQQETVGNGSDPDIAAAVLVEAVGNDDRTAHAGSLFLFRHLVRFYLHGIGVHIDGRHVEAPYKKLAGLVQDHAGHESPFSFADKPDFLPAPCPLVITGEAFA